MEPIKDNIFYIGIENPVILIDNSDTLCDVEIRGSEAVEVIKAERDCIYYITPKHKNKPSFIEVNNEKIDFSHNLKPIPNPTIKLNLDEGFISLNDIVTKNFLPIQLSYFNYDAQFKIESVFIRIIRDNKLIYTETSKYGRFSNEFKQSLKVGDNVDFSNIIIIAPEGSRRIEGIEFKIKN